MLDTSQSQGSKQNRVGADIGGTFTDVVLEVGSRRYSTKVLTTHGAPEQGVLSGVSDMVATAGISSAEVGRFVHGTTLATNALIERRGARTALLTTEGFRDVLEVRSEDRYEQYDLSIDLPRPLVPRKLRFTIDERVDAQGNVRIPLDEQKIARIAGELQQREIESLAIGFIHSYRFPDHEHRARDLLARHLPNLWITLSSDVAPEMREYERFSTACANAYVQPLMAGYLSRLQEELLRAGFTCSLELMLSGGGLTTVDISCRYPVRLVESGPAGGAIFSSYIARQCELDRVVSFDMGGTTAKICLLEGGEPRTSRSFEVARMYRFKRGSGIPLRIPVIDMVEIGAGGGSIASVDALARVNVGPESAGSEPGPACYGRGGQKPTVTDADVVLGRIDPDEFAGGTIRLDAAQARSALQEGIGKPQNLEAPLAAWAISEIVEENMANAARVHAIESGTELSGRTLIAFGGAAPLHALRLAEKIGIDRVIIPSGAGVGSAVGFLRAPISFEVVRSHHALLSKLDLEATDHFLSEMSAQASRIVADAAGSAATSEKRVVFMRYAGQGHEISVTMPNDSLRALGREAIRTAFDAEYRRTYGRVIMDLDVELLSWAITVSAPGAIAGDRPAKMVVREPVPTGKRKLYDSKSSRFVDVAVHRREDLKPGDRIPGPAIIVERETSTLLPSSFVSSINAWGYIECVKTP